ncbi:DUF58 domain-containing protein [Tissierella creatinophila]|uniref:DUF58 domain-containing protein n=1 Tax=Tissierella creatinophila DSM 6911 TaxID=1123403 RepID=A0A1U7M7I6_TISCR|nr:DUF58 domain-containing protein [Tissierella creatinophila]OLS03272.1 hypothetical protein TICRE_07000 [Tissierella creatinophila DSM 6911]
MSQNLIDSKLIKKLERLSLNSNLVLDKGFMGGRKSKSKGSSVEFSDFREYTEGDDFRKIDWNAYARFEKLFIKLFTEEREASVNIFIDTTKSMDYGNPKKSFIASQIAAVIGYVSILNMDRVSIYTTKESRLDYIENINGKNLFRKLVNYIETLSFKETKDMFELINKRPFKKGISVIISDMFTDNFETAIKYLSYMNQNIIVIHTLSKEELKPKYVGDIRFIDSETKEGKDVTITLETLVAYEKTLDSFLSNIKETCTKYGCFYSLIENDDIEEIIFNNLINTGILR